MTVSGEKYEAISTDSGYNKYMILKIRKLSPQDFGSYKCVAKNSLGETDGFIKLDRECFAIILDSDLRENLIKTKNGSRSHVVPIMTRK